MSSFISKVELKKQLLEMGINVEGNYVRKADIDQVIHANTIDVTPRNEDLLNVFDKIAKTDLSRAQMLYDAAFPMGHKKDSEGNHYRMAYKSSSGGVCVKFKPK